MRRYAAAAGEAATLRLVVSTRFRLPLQPGDVLDVDCACTRESDSASLTVKAVCSSAQGKVAEVKTVFRLERDI